MAVRAYVLMNLATSNLPDTIKQIKSIKEVKNVAAVIGPYDCIVELEADNMERLGKIVVDRILKVDGVAKTLTCVKI